VRCHPRCIKEKNTGTREVSIQESEVDLGKTHVVRKQIAG
jgi:hypothetical protein